MHGVTPDELTRSYIRFRDRGDPAALARVFDATAPALLAVARHLLSEASAAEDLVQQTFLTAIERASAFRDGAPVRPWLFGILVRHVHNERRRRARSRMELAGDVSEVPSIDEGAAMGVLAAIECAETRAEIERAISEIASPFREVVAASVLEGASAGEIATRLQRTPGLVYSQLHRGLRFLRGLLAVGFAPIVPREMERMRSRVLDTAMRAKARSAPEQAAAAARRMHPFLIRAAILAIGGGLGAGALLFALHQGPEIPSIEELRFPAARAVAAASVPDPVEAAVVREEVQSQSSDARMTIEGRVVGSGRFAVSGAEVEARMAGVLIARTTSNASGGFTIRFDEPLTGGVALIARTNDGRSGLASCSRTGVRSFEAVIPVERTKDLKVSVLQDGAAVEGADVDLQYGAPFWQTALAATTRRDGVAQFASPPPGLVSIRARHHGSFGRVCAVLPDEDSITLELHRGVDFVMQVTNSVTKEPIAGAAVAVLESVPSPIASPFDSRPRLMQELAVPLPVTGIDGRNAAAVLTDEKGFARGTALRSEADAAVRFSIRAPGFEPSVATFPIPPDPSEAGHVAMEMSPVAVRPVLFRIVSGALPAPRNGTRVWVHERADLGAADLDLVRRFDPLSLTIENGCLLIPRWEGEGDFRATTDDGAVAMLHVDRSSAVGRDAAFDRLANATLRLLDFESKALAGQRLKLQQGSRTNWTEFGSGLTNEQGIVTIEDLPREEFDVQWEEITSIGAGVIVGAVDLRAGNASADLVMPRTAIVRLRIRTDGVFELPLQYNLAASRTPCPILNEDPRRGELSVGFVVGAGEEGLPIHIVVEGRDRVPAAIEVVPLRDREAPEVVMDLARSGTLDIEVRRPGGQVAGVRLERMRPGPGDSAKLEPTSGAARTVPNGPHGTFRFENLEAGIYRAIDERSQAVSEAVEVGAGTIARARLE